MNLSPNPLSTDAVKDTDAFGLKVMRTCYNRWNNGYGGETFNARIARINKNRLYAAGKQPTEQYRDIVKVEGQIQVVNLDYSPLAIAVPLLNAKKDRYMERVEKIRCRAMGPVSQTRRDTAKEEARFKLNHAQEIMAAQQKSGMQLEQFSEDDPRSEQELEIRFRTTYKQKEEIIMQMGLDMVFEQNSWDDVIKDMIIQDIFTAGYSITLTELNGNGWIKTPRVNPTDFITSYSEFSDFNDWQWQGQRRSLSIQEVRLRYPNKLSEQELFDLARSCKGKYGNGEFDWSWDDNFNTAIARPYDIFNVEVVDLYYKTLYNITYERKTNSFGREILKETKKTKDGIEYERSKPYYVAYHGVYVIGTDYVLEWGLAKNMLKPNNNLVEIRSPYTIHMYNNNKCRNTPLVETMIPLIDLIQNIHLQTQKIIAMTAPDGFNIDIMGLSNMDMGEGVGIITPMQALGIYLQTGNQYFMSKEGDSDKAQAPPITPQNHQFSNKLEQLEQQWQAAYAKLQRITGDNNLAAGNITNQAVANSTLNDARDLAENASNYVYKSYLNVRKGTAINAQILLLDKFFGIDESFDGYVNALGKNDVKYIVDMCEGGPGELVFDTRIESALDAVDQQRWDKRIEIALANKEITLADVAELELIDDVTYRSFMLAQKAKDKVQQDMAINKANSENNTQQAIAAADTTGKHAMDLETAQHKNKLEQLQVEQAGEGKKQAYQFSGELKNTVAKAILTNPTATIDSIPAFIWEGLGIIEQSQKQLMVDSLQAQAMQKQAAMAQMQQEQVAQAQQSEAQQGPDMGGHQQPMEQQQEQAAA
jgi:lambda repressor-like predicted transcriptional regulator